MGAGRDEGIRAPGKVPGTCLLLLRTLRPGRIDAEHLPGDMIAEVAAQFLEIGTGADAQSQQEGCRNSPGRTGYSGLPPAKQVWRSGSGHAAKLLRCRLFYQGFRLCCRQPRAHVKRKSGLTGLINIRVCARDVLAGRVEREDGPDPRLSQCDLRPAPDPEGSCRRLSGDDELRAVDARLPTRGLSALAGIGEIARPVLVDRMPVAEQDAAVRAGNDGLDPRSMCPKTRPAGPCIRRAPPQSPKRPADSRHAPPGPSREPPPPSRRDGQSSACSAPDSRRPATVPFPSGRRPTPRSAAGRRATRRRRDRRGRPFLSTWKCRCGSSARPELPVRPSRSPAETRAPLRTVTLPRCRWQYWVVQPPPWSRRTPLPHSLPSRLGSTPSPGCPPFRRAIPTPRRRPLRRQAAARPDRRARYPSPCAPHRS